MSRVIKVIFGREFETETVEEVAYFRRRRRRPRDMQSIKVCFLGLASDLWCVQVIILRPDSLWTRSKDTRSRQPSMSVRLICFGPILQMTLMRQRSPPATARPTDRSSLGKLSLRWWGDTEIILRGLRMLSRRRRRFQSICVLVSRWRVLWH